MTNLKGLGKKNLRYSRGNVLDSTFLEGLRKLLKIQDSRYLDPGYLLSFFSHSMLQMPYAAEGTLLTYEPDDRFVSQQAVCLWPQSCSCNDECCECVKWLS